MGACVDVVECNGANSWVRVTCIVVIARLVHRRLTLVLACGQPWTNCTQSTVSSLRHKQHYVALHHSALLPQKDRATRHVSRYLVNCCKTVRTSCTTNRQQIEVTKLEKYGRPTCNKLGVSSHDASTVVGVVNKLDYRRVLLTTPLTCSGEIF